MDGNTAMNSFFENMSEKDMEQQINVTSELYYDRNQAQRMMEAFAMSQAIEFAEFTSKVVTVRHANGTWQVDGKLYPTFDLYKMFIKQQEIEAK